MGHALPLIVVNRGGPGSAVSTGCAVKLLISTPKALAEDIAGVTWKLREDQALKLRTGVEAHRYVTKTALWSAKINRMVEIYASWQTLPPPDKLLRNRELLQKGDVA
jgi:hypothetical protein